MEQKSIDQNLRSDVCFDIDDWIRDADQTIWIADLSNGLTAYRDDGRPEHVYSAWSRLKQYCEEHDVYVKSLVLKFRSHVEKIPQSEVYFMRNSLLGGFSKKGVRNDHSLLVGTLQEEVLVVQKWKVPELILTSTNERPIDENALRSMIWKKNTSHLLPG